MKTFAIVSFLICTQCSRGAFERETLGSVSLGFGGACVPGEYNTWALAVNPAALGLLATRSVSVSYRPHAFGLAELARGSFVLVEPLSLGNLAVSGSYFGYTVYRETSFSITYACALQRGITLGASLHAYFLGIMRYGSARTFGVDLGLNAEMKNGLLWSIAALNVNRPRLGNEGEPLPQIFWLSLTYEPISHATIAADLVKDLHFPYELRFGLGYRLAGMVGVRAGISSDPALQTGGIGLSMDHVQFDYALSRHAELGMTHQVSLSLYFGDPHHEWKNSLD